MLFSMLSQRLKITTDISVTHLCVVFTASETRPPAIEAFRGCTLQLWSSLAGRIYVCKPVCSVVQGVYLCMRVCEGYRMLLGGLGLQVFAAVCRPSIIVLTLCRCSEVGGGCRVLHWTWGNREEIDGVASKVGGRDDDGRKKWKE